MNTAGTLRVGDLVASDMVLLVDSEKLGKIAVGGRLAERAPRDGRAWWFADELLDMFLHPETIEAVAVARGTFPEGECKLSCEAQEILFGPEVEAVDVELVKEKINRDWKVLDEAGRELWLRCRDLCLSLLDKEPAMTDRVRAGFYAGRQAMRSMF